jgi:hypothetical protein
VRPFGEESFVFPFNIKEFKDKNAQNYNFCMLLCVGVNLVYWIKGAR